MKKLFVALGLCLSVGLLGTLQINHYQCAKAEETSELSTETSETETTELESVEETSEEEIGSLEEISITSEDISAAETIYENIKSGANDVLQVIIGVLEQPIVIAGVSTTLGVLIILAFTKFFSVLTKKKVNDCFEQIKVLGKRIDENISKEQYDIAISQIKELKSVVELLVDSTKNVKVKEKAKELLESIKPVIDETKEYAIETKEEVVEYSKEKVGEVSNHAKDSAKSIMEIVNKD